MIENEIRQILLDLGEDPEREGLLKTPERVRKSLQFLTRGYKQNIDEVINGAIFNEDCDDMIIVRDIEFYSMCEHHMLPFFGKVHLGYVPRGKVFGVSKLARLVDVFARRLQIQERMTRQIAGRRGRCGGSSASLHAHARSGKTEFRHENLLHARQFPPRGGNAS